MEKNKESFEKWLEFYKEEVRCFSDFLYLYNYLHKNIFNSFFDEINICPAFFKTIERSLLISLNLGICKLVKEKEKNNLYDFLRRVEANKTFFKISEMEIKKINCEHKTKLDLLQKKIDSNTKIRDKYFAHIDNNFEILYDDFINITDNFNLYEEVLDVCSSIVKYYYTSYHDIDISMQPVNINDIKHLLERVKNEKLLCKVVSKSQEALEIKINMEKNNNAQ